MPDEGGEVVCEEASERRAAQHRGIADRRYAVAPEDPVGRIMGMSVAITSRTGRPLGALTLAGIPERLSSERIPDLTRILTSGVATLTDTMLRIPSSARHSARWLNAAGAAGKAKA